jgi:hypothetical protein
MSLPAQLPLWFWPALALAAALFYLYRHNHWPFDGPPPSPVTPPVTPPDPLRELHVEILRGLLSKQGLLPPLTTPTSPKMIELPRRFMIVPMDEIQPAAL